MSSIPALLSGCDNERLGLLHVSSNVHSIELNENDHGQAKIPDPPPLPLTSSSFIGTYGPQFQGRGCLGPPVHFQFKPSSQPAQAPVHRVPLSKRQKEYETIQQYAKEGVLTKVCEPTPWCSNELIRERLPSADHPGKFRICIDPSQTLNKALEWPVIQMPILMENLHKLSGAKCFTIVDVKEGFLNIPLDHESSMATTMHTSFGRYRWLRLPFGVSSAPEEFQLRLMTALEGLDGLANIADDILVFCVGNTYAEAELDHDKNLIALMNRAVEKDIRLNLAKLKFKLKEVKFMGDGKKPDQDKVRAIVDLPQPHDKAALLRFIGMMNYLSPFCPNLSATLKPLRSLTHDGVPYLWSSAQEEAFMKAKDLVAQATTLRYYDLGKPMVLQVDASSRGLGGALLQPDDSGSLFPVAYTSSSLSSTETNYEQIEKECLAICQAFHKWDTWLYGNPNVVVHTDHQPLETIFKKPLNKAPVRLQCMIMRLQRYRFKVVYKKGTTLHLADTLSRAPLPNLCNSPAGFEVFHLDVESLGHNEHLTSETEKSLQEQTAIDPVLSKLMSTVISGWPEHKESLEPSLKPYWPFRDELSVYNSIVYKGQQCVVQQSMQSPMLKKIHANHMGGESNIRMARQVLFWPGMRGAIQDTCQACSECERFNKAAPTEPMLSMPIPEQPWELISQDTFGLNGQDYLVTICHYSDFIEVDILENLSSDTAASKTEMNFAHYGVPDKCHTDNVGAFTGEEYESLAKKYGFIHTTSDPYHSQGNGKAESAVDIVKSMLKKGTNLAEALLLLHNTPPKGHTYSPSQRMFLRSIRNTLPLSSAALQPVLVDPRAVQQEILQRRSSAKAQYDKKQVLYIRTSLWGHTPMLSRPQPDMDRPGPMVESLITLDPVPTQWKHPPGLSGAIGCTSDQQPLLLHQG